MSILRRVVISCLLFLYSLAAGAVERVETADLYRAQKLKLFDADRDLALETSGRAWDFRAGATNRFTLLRQEDQWIATGSNGVLGFGGFRKDSTCVAKATTAEQVTPRLAAGSFTWFSPDAKDLQATNGVLRFTAGADCVRLGWGNFGNRQPAGERLNLWPGWNVVELTVKQSAAASDWTLKLLQEGDSLIIDSSLRSLSGAITLQLKGSGRQTLSFLVHLPSADGFQLDIKGPVGNRIEIESMRVLQKAVQGYFRKTFVLPEGRVWRAAAEVAREMTLYVNGREIPFQSYNRAVFVTTAVDLAPYLKAGTNCLAMSARYPIDQNYRNYPGLFYLGYLQGNVVMNSGAQVPLDTDGSWRASATASNGWNATGFDDRAWAPAEKDPAMDVSMSSGIYRWPVYDGRLELENPGSDPKLFFGDGQPLHVRVCVPEGLAGKKPQLRWVLRKAAAEATTNSLEVEITKGTVVEFEQTVTNLPSQKIGRLGDASLPGLQYTIDAGKVERGVYTLEVSLWTGDQCLEKRIREPLVVTGLLPMREVAGTNYEDGMTLALENTIDFTNEKDPHPWVEVEISQGASPARGLDTPRIIRKQNMIYRETAIGVTPGRTASFSYRFQFQHPGSFYLMVLEYPNDENRAIGVGVNPVLQHGRADIDFWIVGENTSGPAVITGFKYPLSGRMQELRWLHYAYTGDHTLDVLSLAKGRRAAAARVRIYRVTDLPALRVAPGERRLGIHTERARTVAKIFGGDNPSDYEYVYTAQKLDMVGRFTQRLKWYLEGAENYTRYLRFSGQNLHVMGAFQYDEEDFSYSPPELVASARIPQRDIRDTALRVFATNGIEVMSMVEYCVHKRLAQQRAINDAQMVSGADTIFPVAREGKQAGSYGCVRQANFDHPVVQESYLRVIDELAVKFGFCPAWKGIYVMAFPAFSGPAAYAPADKPMDYDYSDATIAAFQRDTGLRVPGDPKDPRRFEQRYAFLMSDTLRPKWIEWRCQTVRRLVLRTRDVLQKHRPDLQTMYGMYLDARIIDRYCQSGRGYLEVLREYGWDPTLFRQDQDIWVGRYLYPNDCQGYLQGVSWYAAVWQQHVGKEPISAYARADNRLVVLNTLWHEMDVYAPGCTDADLSRKPQPPAPPDWPFKHLNTRYVSQANVDNAREKFTQAMIGADPQMIMYGLTDAMFPLGHEQEAREFARAFTPLPRELFQPVGDTTDFQHNLAIRDLHKDGAYWFYVANPGYWPIKGSITLSGECRVSDPATGDVVLTQKQNGKTVVPVDLKGFALVAFVVRGLSDVGRLSSGVRVSSWTNAPVAESDLKHMRDILNDARQALAQPAIARTIKPEDQAFISGTMAASGAALDSLQYAKAWSALTDWRFWTLRDAWLQARVREARSWPGLNVIRIEQPPQIDGRLNEALWKTAPKTERFCSVLAGGVEAGAPTITTAVQVVYDRTNLYLGFTLNDPDLKALRKTAAQPEAMFDAYDDVMVMLFRPAGTNLFQLAVNAGGLCYNANVTGKTGSFRKRDETFRKPWTAAVAETNGAWTIEVAVPFDTLQTPAPQAGQQWRANFLRRFRQFQVPEMYWAVIDNSWYESDVYGALIFK